jgi:hypothetical protein
MNVLRIVAELVADLINFDMEGLAGFLTVLVDKRIGQYFENPGLEVCLSFKLVKKAPGTNVHILHQVLGVQFIACHPQGGAVQRIHVLISNFLKLTSSGGLVQVLAEIFNHQSTKPIESSQVVHYYQLFNISEQP